MLGQTDFNSQKWPEFLNEYLKVLNKLQFQLEMLFISLKGRNCIVVSLTPQKTLLLEEQRSRPIVV